MSVRKQHSFVTRLRRSAILVGAVSLAACGGRDTQTHLDTAAGSAAVPLYENLGELTYPVSTGSPEAQRYFDQGLRLTYAFNHAEAIRSYREASRLDPDCAMCYWGEALAYGPNINLPMDSAGGAQAYVALMKAREHAGNASEKERDLIEALARRYSNAPAADRARLDSAYAVAMREVADRYPDDVNAQTLYAESMMLLSPWAYWEEGGRPRPGTQQILTRLEGAIEREPNHPGACHYYIHAVEAAHPERAVPCAERLASLMPGAGHLVHMPAHIYIRVGRWADAITANEHAVHTDETYIADVRPQSIYPMFYYPHNIHFLAFAATMAGRSAMALENARQLPEKIPAAVAEQFAEGQLLVAYPYLTRVSFARWDEILAEPMPASNLAITTGLAHYARGTARAAKGDAAAAGQSLDSLRLARTANEDPLGASVLEIAEHALQGEIAWRGGRHGEAIAHFGVAARLEDGLQYMEPPFWYYPMRHSLGAALIDAGRHAEAERAFREDLARFPENGWALRGLSESLRRQGQTVEADRVAERFRAAWSAADVQLTRARL